MLLSPGCCRCGGGICTCWACPGGTLPADLYATMSAGTGGFCFCYANDETGHDSSTDPPPRGRTELLSGICPPGNTWTVSRVCVPDSPSNTSGVRYTFDCLPPNLWATLGQFRFRVAMYLLGFEDTTSTTLTAYANLGGGNTCDPLSVTFTGFTATVSPTFPFAVCTDYSHLAVTVTE